MTERQDEPTRNFLPAGDTARPGPAPVPGPHLPFNPEQAERLRWAQKMEAMGRLGTRVAHEINNHITIVLGRAALLLGRAETPPGVRGDVTDIYTVAERIADLMREWLTLGRREKPVPRRVDLNALVVGLIPMLKVSLGEDVEVAAEYCAAPGLVLADRGQLEQVILNLAVNARDAMDGRGRLVLTTADVRLDEAAARYPLPASPGAYVMLAVRDTGCGMDRATIEHIFDPYFTTKEPGKGTGLGLYTVWEIVRASGGTLQVASAPGQGTTFAVYLPRAPEGVVAPGTPRPGAPEAGRETVLVIGNDDLIRNLLREILARDGFTALESRAGPEALQLCAERAAPVCLLVIDSTLPSEGVEVVRRLRETYPDAPVLQVGGLASEGYGPNFLPKPFAPEELVRKARNLLAIVR